MLIQPHPPPPPEKKNSKFQNFHKKNLKTPIFKFSQKKNHKTQKFKKLKKNKTKKLKNSKNSNFQIFKKKFHTTAHYFQPYQFLSENVILSLKHFVW
jgi:hypothetical protein